MRALTLALALFATPAWAENELQPLAFLEGCWLGTFDGPQALQDERCFELTLDGRVLRDRHTVVGAGYSGETLYAWNAETRRIEAMYYANDGGLMTGRVSEEGDGLWLRDGRYVGADGAVQELRSRWIRSGQGFVVETERLEQGAWVRLMRIAYERAAPAE